MVRILMSLVIGSLVTLGLFVFMSKLIDNDDRPTTKPTPTPVIDPVSEPKQLKPNERPSLPPKTPAVEPPPAIPSEPDALSSDPNDQLPIEAPPEITVNHQSPTLIVPSDGEARPVVRVEPKYPIKAATNGIVGYVVMQFSIMADGSTGEIEVVDASPKRTFEREAVRALKKWKYRPKVVDGNSVIQQGLRVRLDFDITD